MARIKLDLRIKELINGAVSSNHRAMLVVIGDGAKKQVSLQVRAHFSVQLITIYAVVKSKCAV